MQSPVPTRPAFWSTAQIQVEHDNWVYVPKYLGLCTFHSLGGPSLLDLLLNPPEAGKGMNFQFLNVYCWGLDLRGHVMGARTSAMLSVWPNLAWLQVETKKFVAEFRSRLFFSLPPPPGRLLPD